LLEGTQLDFCQGDKKLESGRSLKRGRRRTSLEKWTIKKKTVPVEMGNRFR